MRLSIILLLTTLGASLAQAQSRPDSLRMTCGQASALVQSRGSIVLGTGPDIYDRFVASCGFCFNFEFLVPSWIRTADSPQCCVGYRCDSQTPSQPWPSCGVTGYRGP